MAKTITKKKKSGNESGVALMVVSVLLLAALGTAFLPVVKVKIPVVGEKSWKVADIAKTIPDMKFGEAKKRSSFQLNYDFIDVVMKILPRNETTKEPIKLSPTFILGILVPFALLLTYALMLIGLPLVFLKQGSLFIMPSALGVICGVYSLFGIYYLGLVAQRLAAAEVEKASAGFLGALTKNFVAKFTIQPDVGLYVLVGLTVLVFGANYYRAKIRS